MSAHAYPQHPAHDAPPVPVTITDADTGEETETDLAALLLANPEDDDIADAVPAILRGEAVPFGGGAAPLVYVRRT